MTPADWANPTDEQLLREGGHETYDHLNPTPEALEKMKALVMEHLMTHAELGDQILASCVVAAVKPLLAALTPPLEVEIERDETPGSMSALCFTVRSGERRDAWVRLDLSLPVRLALWHGRNHNPGEIYRSRAVFERSGSVRELSDVIAHAAVQMLQGLRTRPVSLPSR